MTVERPRMVISMPISHLALILLVILVWGFNFVVIKTGLEEISPVLLGFGRFFLTSIPAVFFIKRPKAPWKMVAWYGLVMFALQFFFLFMGIYVGVAPGLASLLIQLHVFFTVLLAVIFFGEKLHLWSILGAIISFSGIAVIGVNANGSATLSGILLIIGAAASWGAGNVLSKKIGKVDMVSLVVWGSLVAWPPLLLVSLCTEGFDKILYTIQHLNLLSIGSVLYIGYLATLFGFGVWSWLLHHHPMNSVAPFTLLVPIVAILSSAAVLGEPLQLWKMVAALLVITGLCVHVFGPRFLTRLKGK